MKQEQQNLYEVMFVVKASLSDDARRKACEKIVADIESFGGKVDKMIEMGRKKLAYQIDDQRDGYYNLYYFNLRPSANVELQREFRLNEDVIRFVTLRAEKVLDKLEFPSLVEE